MNTDKDKPSSLKWMENTDRGPAHCSSYMSLPKIAGGEERGNGGGVCVCVCVVLPSTFKALSCFVQDR